MMTNNAWNGLREFLGIYLQQNDWEQMDQGQIDSLTRRYQGEMYGVGA